MQNFYKLDLDIFRDGDICLISSSLTKKFQLWQNNINEQKQAKTFEKENSHYPLDEFIYTCNTESARIAYHLTCALEYIPKDLVISHNPY